ALPAHELSEQRDPVTRLDRRVEGMGDPEDRVVDQHLDVLAELAAVPERGLQLGVARRQPFENGPQGRTGRHGLIEHPPTRAVAADELRDPGDDFYRDRPHRSFASHSAPSAVHVWGSGLPVLRSKPTSAYQVSSIFSHCPMTAWPFAGPS